MFRNRRLLISQESILKEYLEFLGFLAKY